MSSARSLVMRFPNWLAINMEVSFLQNSVMQILYPGFAILTRINLRSWTASQSQPSCVKCLHCQIGGFTGSFRIASGVVAFSCLQIFIGIRRGVQLIGKVINHKCGSGQRCGTGDDTGEEITKLAHKTLLVGDTLVDNTRGENQCPRLTFFQSFFGIFSHATFL